MPRYRVPVQELHEFPRDVEAETPLEAWDAAHQDEDTEQVLTKFIEILEAPNLSNEQKARRLAEVHFRESYEPQWDDKQKLMVIEEVVPCKLCKQHVILKDAHRHQGEHVGDECCWDERLRSTE